MSAAAATNRLSPSALEDVCDLAAILAEELMAGLNGSPEEVDDFIRKHGGVLVGELLPVLEAFIEPAALRAELLRLRGAIGERHIAGLRLASARSCRAAKAIARDRGLATSSRSPDRASVDASAFRRDQGKEEKDG